jgi:glucose/arabinose dehydrogenase
LVAIACCALAATAAVAAPPTVTLRPVAGTLALPVAIAHAGDGSGRLFIAEQAGIIKVLKGGALLGTPFLDLTAPVLNDSGERGLLGLAFHPQFAANHKFYVFYTRKPDGAVQVAEFLASVGNPDVADAGSGRPVISVPHAVFGNHNGGHIAFGPEGYLYVAVGDGGGGGDPDNNGQNTNALLGKILRIDVNAGSGYRVPPTNPFVGQAGAGEVWAYGLRNPWKFSFDRLRGDLYIADVGQGLWEEVNFEPAGFPGGRNYGWRVMEGAHCFNPASGCNAVGKVPPILEHSHASGLFAIVGGYVYRGTKSSALRGYYLYGDYINSSIWAASTTDFQSWSTQVLVGGPGNLSTFGEDESGELYVVNRITGVLYSIDSPGPALAVPRRYDFDGDGKADILWRHAGSGEDYLYPMDGSTIKPGEGHIRAVADLNWKVAGIGDFDGDGKSDILWRNGATGENYIYFMDGTAIKPAEGHLRAVADLNWQVAGVGDFNGDGRDDILWRNGATGENYLYPMDGLNVTGTEGFLRTVADQAWRVAGVGDFDGDGRADILWRHAGSGENYLYPMNGTAIKPMENYVRTVADLQWKVAGVGDYDGDGKSDILWRNASTGENYLYPMTGFAIKSAEGYLRTVADQNWQVKGTGDYDGDGKADILWRHAVTGENYLYPMDGKTIKPGEGYLRTVVDPSWLPVGVVQGLQ